MGWHDSTQVYKRATLDRVWFLPEDLRFGSSLNDLHKLLKFFVLSSLISKIKGKRKTPGLLLSKTQIWKYSVSYKVLNDNWHCSV